MAFLNQPLARLRDLFGDPLLVRIGTAMVQPESRSPAQAARRIRSKCKGCSEHGGVARTSRRRFRLMLPDLVAHRLMPSVMERLSRAAPDIRIDLIPWRGPALLTDRALNESIFSSLHSTGNFRVLRNRRFTRTPTRWRSERGTRGNACFQR
ncbi:hypothetical protein [Bradyrhizobium sp.]|uniref:hypothetical protein n=1 Tax=Bradyrhizobium sp. TaxID=376 RepID=UPI003BB03A36